MVDTPTPAVPETPKAPEAAPATPAPEAPVAKPSLIPTPPAPAPAAVPTPAPAAAPTIPAAPAVTPDVTTNITPPPAVPAAPVVAPAPAAPAPAVAPAAPPIVNVVTPNTTAAPQTTPPAAPAPAAAPEPAKEEVKAVVKEAAKEWFSEMGLDEAGVSFMQKKKFGSMGDMITSMTNLEKFAGGSKNVVEIPGADADPEIVKAFKVKLGAPEKMEDLDLSSVLPEGEPSPLVEVFKEAVVENGVPVDAAINIVKKVVELEGKIITEQDIIAKAKDASDVEELKKELGVNFDPTVEKAERAIAAVGIDGGELSKKMGVKKAVEIAAAIGEKIVEDALIENNKTNNDFAMTPEGAKEEKAKLLSDEAFKKVFMDEKSPGQADAIKKIEKLTAMQTGVKI